jgi:serine/threonine-protein kinase
MTDPSPADGPLPTQPPPTTGGSSPASAGPAAATIPDRGAGTTGPYHPAEGGAGADTKPSASPAPLPTIPGFVVEAELGRGGMGVVYRAHDTALNRTVAIKMVLAGAHASEQERARFLAEAEAVAALQHPGIVQVFHIGRHEGLPYFVLEFCPGGSLADKIAREHLPPRQAAGLVETLARAVAHAHAHNVVHRDLKPGNVLLAADRTPKVSDFGLAKRLGAGEGLTHTGAVLGTPQYMAPEQAAGEARRVGPLCDVWALGAILYRLLAGEPPFRGATSYETIRQVLEREPVPPDRVRPGVPRDLAVVCLKCLQKDPARRYPSAAALADDLQRWRSGEPIQARPAGCRWTPGTWPCGTSGEPSPTRWSRRGAQPAPDSASPAPSPLGRR